MTGCTDSSTWRLEGWRSDSIGYMNEASVSRVGKY